MKVIVSTTLNAQASHVWSLVKKSSTLTYICRGLLGFQHAENLPEEWKAGETIQTRLHLFSFIPAWQHQIHFVGIQNYSLLTKEQGGVISRWEHEITLDDISEHQTLYSDQVDIEAGVFTPIIFMFAHGFYRYRQYRWKRLLQMNNQKVLRQQFYKGDVA